MAKTPEEIQAEAEAQKKAAEDAQAAQQKSAAEVPTIESEADLDRRFVEMMERDAQADREREEKRVLRQQAALNLSGIGGLIGDAIKASGGAVVNPRDLESHYARLDNRQKQLYDTYRARMDAIRQGKLSRDLQRGREARAAAAREAELKNRREEFERTDEYKRWKAQLENDTRVKVAQERAQASLRTRQGTGGEQEILVPFAGHEYAIQKKAYDGRMAQLYSYLKQNNLFSKDSGAETAELKNVMALFSSNAGSKADESSKAKMAIACLVSINELPADSEHAANVIKILQGTYGQASKPAATAQPAGQQTTTKTAPWVKK